VNGSPWYRGFGVLKPTPDTSNKTESKSERYFFALNEIQAINANRINS